jgi:hypothetical protein
MWVSGSFRIDFPSGVSSQSFANPIQHVPSPAACAASIRFSAARAQSPMAQGPWAIGDHDQDGSAIEYVELRIVQDMQEMVRGQSGGRSSQDVRFRFVRNARQQLPVLHDRKQPWLSIDGAGSLDRRVDELAYGRFLHGLGCEFADSPPAVDCFSDVHHRFQPNRNCICIKPAIIGPALDFDQTVRARTQYRQSSGGLTRMRGRIRFEAGGLLAAPRYDDAPYPCYYGYYPPRCVGPTGCGASGWEAHCFSR